MTMEPMRVHGTFGIAGLCRKKRISRIDKTFGARRPCFDLLPACHRMSVESSLT